MTWQHEPKLRPSRENSIEPKKLISDDVEIEVVGDNNSDQLSFARLDRKAQPF